MKTSNSKSTLVLIKNEKRTMLFFDKIMWFLVLFILISGIIANHYLSQYSFFIRGGVSLFTIFLAGFLAYLTQKGKWAVNYLKESKQELKKVIWPTKDETLQTTLIVVIAVFILTILLWLMDGLLILIIGWLTGQR